MILAIIFITLLITPLLSLRHTADYAFITMAIAIRHLRRHIDTPIHDAIDYAIADYAMPKLTPLLLMLPLLPLSLLCHYYAFIIDPYTIIHAIGY
jgi:hypothetical protein